MCAWPPIPLPSYGDWLRSGWRNVMDAVLRLHRLDLLPPAVIAGGLGACVCVAACCTCWMQRG